jgi:3-methyladenine DNA glycosylase AlkD
MTAENVHKELRVFASAERKKAAPIHEDRSCALSILVQRYEKCGERADRSAPADPEPRKTILDFYLHNMQYINNWDLVDCSAHNILGRAIHEGLQEVVILDRLAVSDILWERRIAIIATMYFIHKGQLDHTFRLAERLLADREDLMHKAVGWMLREAWKKDPAAVETFLIKHYPQIPRTALRYAIEKMEETKRQRFLKGRF